MFLKLLFFHKKRWDKTKIKFHQNRLSLLISMSSNVNFQLVVKKVVPVGFRLFLNWNRSARTTFRSSHQFYHFGYTETMPEQAQTMKCPKPKWVEGRTKGVTMLLSKGKLFSALKLFKLHGFLQKISTCCASRASKNEVFVKKSRIRRKMKYLNWSFLWFAMTGITFTTAVLLSNLASRRLAFLLAEEQKSLEK